ncbi:MAG: hypothetical protein JKY37_13580 [Nannocystaceae bacterium]|nr:hypothetical protein [Nannocystaceae bacterium]
MVRLRVQTLAVTLVAAACTRSGDSPAPTASAPQSKADKCRRIADNATKTAGMAATLLVAGLDGEEMSPSDKAGLRAELKVSGDALAKRCLTWDDEVFRCFSLFGGGNEKCERIVAVAMGDDVAPVDPPAGPAPAWTFDLSQVPEALAITGSGHVIVLLEDSVMAVADGAQLWSVAVPSPMALALPPAGTSEPLLVLHPDGVLGIQQDGTVAFRKALPTDDEEAPAPKTLARLGDGWLLGDADARFIRLQPSACAKTGRGCMTVVGALPEEYFDRSTTLIPLADGSTLLWEEENLRHLDASFNALFDARGLDALDGVMPKTDGTIVAFFDNDLVTLDLTRCRSAAPFAPSSYPQPNRLYFADDSACEDCKPPPPECLVARNYVKDGDGAEPAVTTDGAVVVRTADATVAFVDGKRAWGHVLAAAGDPLAIGSDVLVVGDTTYNGEGELSLWRLGKDGVVVWRVLPPAVRDGDLYWSDDGRLAATGQWAAVSVKQKLSVYPL